MQTNRKNVSKEIIIETTLRLIEEKGGIKDVNLREIAKNIGCAHTNLYNYFNSLDEIFWEALGQVLLKMIDYVDVNLAYETDPEEKLYLALSNIIDFSMDHPGWYRLIWLEAIDGTPSSEVNEILHLPTRGFNAMLIKLSNNKLSEERANLIGDILMTYLHGELCKWINNRSFKNSRSETKMSVFSNLKYLYKLLIQREEDKA
ncbi:transcriptional regulator, TetR family [Clostridium pasteurianum DSM 525 = ATCC 6013]|uniref:Transcriptional regulator, TetR family n=1 Tax=Clostridium pasteurianum DSM 525 = ATCC 6013 TaxID=1262449 RepID=A0A0H3JAV6_CLOPA|nr:TetR/AcrR family transcriptional regulator [Clostridium pasteurianum]AJA49893.1 transcriptional regulator, TetR family [Clostridium pasteurianum DSM 525 = ATCC 6013]AJA53881.1 transcriptional regulator, TetR family [Clostridium pasteurianum DSM 525 = ATCC 6013]AOZ77033.1 TetR family transcriptional regulator [Clostridium pasteurianum DSM 525 = ATCC 6013]AOZ80830.1 TetR family transcriptional regulator [Clostridium pasteurianum]ELP57852.1 regulatory protein TetR [Clostridium pasteurianum DSM